MNQVITARCYSCGVPVNPQDGDYCSHCHYPVSTIKEEEYLNSTLASLQQAMSYGAGGLKVVDLFQRYQKRLRVLQKLSTTSASIAAEVENAPQAARRSGIRVASLVYQIDTPGKVEVATAPEPVKPLVPRRLFSWRSFFADQAINIVASLGAFLILVGALSFVATTSNLILAFLIIFAVHAVFGITGIITHRFASFRIVANIYSIIFALLVPLVGFSAYRLVGGSYLEISSSVLIAISATYAAITYAMLAVFQRYALFAYLGIAALAVSDLALASVLNLAYWWWPGMLMILALISLTSVACTPAASRVFGGNRAILRQPVRIFMYVFVVMGTVGLAVVALYSILLDRIAVSHSTEAGYALLCLALLRLVWSIGGFYLSRRTRGTVMLALLFLTCVLAFCYALQFDATGYALALTIVALLYAGVSRFATQLLQPLGSLELQLDCMALLLALSVPFIVSPALPLQLVALVYAPGTPFSANWQTFVGVAMLLVDAALVLSIASKRSGFHAVPPQAGEHWLLLLAAFLFTYAFGLLILALHLNLMWSFLGASMAWLAIAVMSQRSKDGIWADPLDIIALSTMLLTLGFSLDEKLIVTGRLLLCFSVVSYAVLFYQRRPQWLVVPTMFAIGAMLIPAHSFWTFLFVTPLLALSTLVCRRFAGKVWSAPFTILALFSSIMAGYTGMAERHFEATVMALLVFALAAFVAALIEKRLFWLWLTAGFATWGTVVASQLGLVYVVGIGIGAAIAGIIAGRFIHISEERATIEMLQRLKQFTWSWPWYATTLLATVLIGFWQADTASQAILISYSLLAFTGFAILILLVERLPELLIFPATYAAGTIWLWYPHLDLPALMVAYSVLCVVIFASQFVWGALPYAKGWLDATTLHEVLGIGGQAVVVMVILAYNGVSADAGTLAQVGAGALALLAVLIFVYGLMRPYNVALSLPAQLDETTRLKRVRTAEEARRGCYYVAGLLLSLVVSWELVAFRQTRIDVLLLAPASYLTVLAPFLLRDGAIRVHRAAGQIAAVLGACLLLLPALWFSFSDTNFLPTAILLGESMALLLLGMFTRVRIFILSSAGLVVVGTLRALFLATPPSLTLMITGGTLLLIATALILTRHKWQVAWKQWE